MGAKYTPEEAKRIVDELMPHITERLLQNPTSWGGWERVHRGFNVSLVNTLFNVSSGEVFIGDNAFFGHNVSLLTGTHDISKYGADRQAEVPFTGRDIHIGAGAWIASNATVLGPCRVGENAVIGVGSVVTGDVKPGWFYAGVPARPIKPVGPEYAGDTPKSARSRVSRGLRRALLALAARL